MAPDYSIAWWNSRQMKPPRVDPVEFMVKRLDWRYAKGLPEVFESDIYLADSATFLPHLDRGASGRQRPRAKLLLTSPPYFAKTNYHYDQWLRLWLLGGPPSAHRIPGTHEVRGKFEHAERYEQMLEVVFKASAELLTSDAVIYVRTGADELTYEITRRVLHDCFPRRRIRGLPRPFTRPTQTMLFGDFEKKAGEVDLVLHGSL